MKTELKIAGLFNAIAGRYDFLNHFLSFGIDFYWRKRLVRMLPMLEKAVCIDVAAGTLDVSLAIAKRFDGFSPQIFACDFSQEMLQRGAKKNHFSCVLSVLADGTKLPFSTACADMVTIAFGLRNIPVRQKLYTESLRVLKVGGKLYVLEFGSAKTSIWKGVYNFYLRRILPIIGKIVSGDAKAYQYLADTIYAFPTAKELMAEMQEAGFHSVGCFSMTGGIVWIYVAEKTA